MQHTCDIYLKFAASVGSTVGVIVGVSVGNVDGIGLGTNDGVSVLYP